MEILGTGLSGTLGRKMASFVKPAQITLGKDRLHNYFRRNESSFTLIHLAGVVGEKQVSQNLDYSELINVRETLNLAKEVIEDFGGRFIHISSSHVYGPSRDDISEEFPLNPQSRYADQKARAEQALMEYFGQNHQQLVVLRVFSVLGWDVADFTLGGLVKRILNGSNELIAHSDDERDFMTPTSIASAILEIAKAEKIYGTFNLSTGNGLSVRQAVLSMFKEIDFHFELGHFESGNSFSPRIVGNNSKLIGTNLKLDLTWNPSNDKS